MFDLALTHAVGKHLEEQLRYANVPVSHDDAKEPWGKIALFEAVRLHDEVITDHLEEFFQLNNSTVNSTVMGRAVYEDYYTLNGVQVSQNLTGIIQHSNMILQLCRYFDLIKYKFFLP